MNICVYKSLFFHFNLGKNMNSCGSFKTKNSFNLSPSFLSSNQFDGRILNSSFLISLRAVKGTTQHLFGINSDWESDNFRIIFTHPINFSLEKHLTEVLAQNNSVKGLLKNIWSRVNSCLLKNKLRSEIMCGR